MGYTLISVELAAVGSPAYQFAVELGRRNSRTLGFLPEGAFEQFAASGQMLVAAEDGVSLGYIVYRLSGTHASIVHLCIAENGRGRGVARKLVSFMSDRVSDSDGIGLWCRCDYAANKLWPRLGFTSVQRKRGRSKAGHELEQWWLTLRRPPLLVDDATVAVLDNSVLARLIDSPCPSDVEALLADWLTEVVKLSVTPEARVDIDRDQDAARREVMISTIRPFESTSADQAAMRSARSELALLVQTNEGNLQDVSDVSHLAHAVAAGSHFFVTKDRKVRRKARLIRERFGTIVCTPAELVLSIATQISAEEYRPAAYRTKAIAVGRLAGHEIEGTAASFLNTGSGEPIVELRSALEACALDTNQVCRILHADGQPIGLLHATVDATHVLNIQRIRIHSTERGNTAAALIVQVAIDTAHSQGCSALVISDNWLPDAVRTRLPFHGFIGSGPFWRPTLTGSVSLENVGGFLRDNLGTGRLRDDVEQYVSEIEGARFDELRVWALQRTLWPVALIGAGIPNYLVTIYPEWAVELADSRLGASTVLEPSRGPLVSVENVYYRSPRGSVAAKSRIYWYVAHDPRFAGSMSLRAAALLDSVNVAKASINFRKFERLGVYGRRDVVAAGRNSGGQTMAMKFSCNREFPSPVSHAELRRIASEAAAPLGTLQAPFAIPDGLVKAIHAAAER